MNAFHEHHKDSIRFGYRCFDRLLLSGLIQPFQQPERVIGFFNTYRGGQRVTRTALTGIADRFRDWITNRSQRWGVPILEAPEGRRDDFLDPYFKRTKANEVVAILRAREPARILIANGNKKDDRWHLQITQRWVNQYSIYINDARWGRMFVRMCPYFPFSARVCLNQHHWLANRMREEGIDFRPCSNAFLKCGNPGRLQELADSLTARDLLTCGQKWLAYFTPFFTEAERRHAGCQHRLFFAQVEYCDNLIFHRRAALDAMGERLLDANRTIGQPNKITTIFGRRVTRQYRDELKTVIEDLDLPNPVIRSHYRSGFIKQYVRDHLNLRTEPATNNVTDYGVKKAVENLPQLRQKMSSIIDNYHNVQQDILETFLDRGQFRKLAEPTVLPNGKRNPWSQTGSPSATRPHARAGALCPHRRREHLRHRRHLSAYHRSTGSLARGLQSVLSPLRLVQVASQTPGRESSALAALSPHPGRLLDLSGVPEAVRANLRAADSRSAGFFPRRLETAHPETIPVGPTLSTRRRRS